MLYIKATLTLLTPNVVARSSSVEMVYKSKSSIDQGIRLFSIECPKKTKNECSLAEAEIDRSSCNGEESLRDKILSRIHFTTAIRSVE